jgi:hypothetical protein
LSFVQQEWPLVQLTQHCFDLFQRYHSASVSCDDDGLGAPCAADFARVQAIFQLQHPSTLVGSTPANSVGLVMDDGSVYVQYPLENSPAVDLRQWVLAVLDWSESVLGCRRLLLCVPKPTSATASPTATGTATMKDYKVRSSASDAVLRSLLYVGFQLHLSPGQQQLAENFGDAKQHPLDSNASPSSSSSSSSWLWLSYEL